MSRLVTLVVAGSLVASTVHAQSKPDIVTKPSSEALKASEGRLRKQLFVVTSKAEKGFAPLKENLKAHLEYLGALEKDGKLFMGGPLFTEDPEKWSGDGLLIYSAKDITEAKSIADGDPLHKSGARSYTLRAWLVNDGSLTLTVKLSDQKGTVGK
jgi:uncharacterized protein